MFLNVALSSWLKQTFMNLYLILLIQYMIYDWPLINEIAGLILMAAFLKLFFLRTKNVDFYHKRARHSWHSQIMYLWLSNTNDVMKSRGQCKKVVGESGPMLRNWGWEDQKLTRSFSINYFISCIHICIVFYILRNFPGLINY